MEELPKIQGMQKRRNGYYLRIRTPKDLLDIYQKNEIIKTLNTSDYYEAKIQLAVQKASLELEFEEKRRKLQLIANQPDMLSAYTDRELERLAKSYFITEYEKRANDNNLPENWNDELFHQHIVDLEIDLQEYQDEVDGLANHPSHHGRRTAIKILKAKDITFDKESDAFEQLSHFMSRALVDLTRNIIRLRQKKSYKIFDPTFDMGKLDKKAIEADLKPKKTISELFDEYLNNPADEKSIATKKNYDGVRGVLFEYWGQDKAVKDITRDDCREIFNVLFKLPKHLKKKAPNLNIQEGIAKGQELEWELIAPKTINMYMNSLRALLRFAERESYIDKNPADNLSAKVTTEKKRLPFTIEQLQNIFNCGLCLEVVENNWQLKPPPQKQKDADMFWIPLISLYTGARMNEICQLEVGDIIEEKEINYFNLTTEDENENKSFKNENSKRKVPIHEELITIGFLRYVEYIQSKGHERLFYDLETGATGKYSDTFTKRFAYHLKKYDLKYPKRVFHSFRHTFRDECRERDIPDSIVEAIGGWAGNKNEADKYGSGYSLGKLNKYLQSIKYEGLSLEHLKASKG